MFNVPVNYLAVLIAAVASIIINLIWYSPILFLAQWMKFSKLDSKKVKKPQPSLPVIYGLLCVSSLITAYILALLINLTLVIDLTEGLILGGIIWLGFVVTTMVTRTHFQEKSWGLFFINSGYHLVSILVMSAILTLWI